MDAVAPMAVAAAAGVLAAPYLAALTLTVPDRANRRWWAGTRPTGRRVLVVALVAAAAGGLAGRAAGPGALLPAFTALALVGAPLAVIDVEHHRLPDRLVAAGAVLGTALLTPAAALGARWSRLGHAALWALVVAAVLFGLALVPSGLGLGDVKLGALLGGYLGWFGAAAVFYGIVAGFVVGSLVALPLLATGRAGRRTALPFGPALLAGALLVLALHVGQPG